MDCFSVRSWSLADLVGIEPRRYLLRPTALEFFFSNGSSALINFYTHYNSPWGVPNPHGSGVRSTDTVAAHKRLREAIVEVICSLSPAQLTHTPSLDTGVAITASSGFSKDTNSMTQRWVRREISNLEYLLWLNRAAGRSFNDITQYPVLPWILSDYRNSPLNLMNASSFRDLTKPVGALDLKRVAQIKENYKSLKDEGQLPFHYGSHYSTAGLICFYLLRLEPFTSMSVELQSGHFDVPDRLFSSIAECWEGCLHGMGDVKELIPEFFFLPEMLVNRSRLPLGDRQNCHGIVDDVELPAWAGDAFDFVWWHRRALETEH
ncbi:BCHC2, partial [Symbiodinium sp. KB8]